MGTALQHIGSTILVATAVAFFAATAARGGEPDADDDDAPAKPVTELIVTARRLDAARARIAPELGASTYALTGEMVDNRPGSESTSINRVLLQAPGVQQDGSGQLRVRQSHGDLQYRINGVILPEGLSDLGESISARIAQKVEIVTGALPAQYGFQAGAVVNVTTKSGAYLNGGQVEVYGGGRGEIEPAFEYGANLGPTNAFVSGSYHRNGAGLASVDGSAHPLHDRSDQIDGFAYLDHVFNGSTRASLILGLSDDRFQIPNLRGIDAGSAAGPRSAFPAALVVQGTRSFTSANLNDRRREATRYAVGSLLRSGEDLTIQASAFFRESVLAERADGIGDVLFKGLGTSTDARDDARGVQVEGVYDLAAAHTVRGGVVASWSRRKAQDLRLALPVDASGRQTSDLLRTSRDVARVATRKASLFLQDEWRPIGDLTVNLGLRYDDVRASQGDRRASPRLSAVWTLPDGYVLHAGYARYFLPAPPDDAGDIASTLAGTTGALPGRGSDPLRAETDDYYDIGIQRSVGGLTVGIDGYWRAARNFLAEGQFGPAHLSAPFNYDRARIRGVELTTTYAAGPFTAWGNLAVAEGQGQGIVSNQAYFTALQLAALASRATALSQDQRVTASAGLSYRWRHLRVIADMLYGSGLPASAAAGPINGANLPAYSQINLALRYTVETFRGKPLDVRLDVLNLFDAGYRLRDGSGLGDGPPQWGPRRGVYVGLEQSF
jgi:outer membrane receptor protein involved in Fe transport